MNDVNRLHTLMAPYSEEAMEAYPVSQRINSPAYEGADLLVRVDRPAA